MSSHIRIKIENIELCKILRVVKGKARNNMIEHALTEFLNSEKGQFTLKLLCPELAINLTDKSAHAPLRSVARKREESLAVLMIAMKK